MTKRILIIGAGGTIGRAVSAAARDLGHEVIAASRSTSPAVDLGDEASIDALFAAVGTVDAVVCATGSVPFKPFTELEVADYRRGLESKTLGQIAVVVRGVAAVADGGSFTLTSGILGGVPIATGAAASAVNGALDAFTMAAATGLPRGIRINTVSPNVLVESPGSHRSFPGLIPVPAAVVAQSFIRSIDGVETGRIFPV
ncbi:short chain dehydrogenase [Microbacterium dextranolyticum]|uniref:Short chain dehydrogenase n=1 Tax=Microbacterium dextranolyticum TaxID=36806 RepID=A0A9W6HQ82_9MICO|nr:short chain dehydrogenase [Microbacterium dextranolyticum]MBM7464078.1 NAD(P)-dependent dehydrogenase (short-subunit alcohol dehydrogenase family) [Microbacterium dextranolyticum]GLJ96594.1 short chain dehydrogenase [Microbacterium dextranolyticum]